MTARRFRSALMQGEAAGADLFTGVPRAASLAIWRGRLDHHYTSRALDPLAAEVLCTHGSCFSNVNATD